MRAEVGGDGRNRDRRPAAGVGEDEHGGDNAGGPGSIPLARMERMTWRTFLRSSSCSGRLQSTAASSAMAARVRARGGGEKERNGEGFSGNGVRSRWGTRGASLPCRGEGRGGPGVELVRLERGARSLQDEDDAIPVIRYGFQNIPVLAPGEIRVQVRMIPDLLPDSLNSRNFLDKYKMSKYCGFETLVLSWF